MRTNNIENFIEKVCNEIKYKSVKENISEEIRNHMNEEKESYLKTGLDEKTAEENTVSNMGSPQIIGQNLNKIHRPKLNLNLIIIAILILLCGIAVSYSLSKTIYKNNFGSESWFAENIVYVISSLIIAILIYFCDYTRLKKYSFHIFSITTTLGIILIYTMNKYISVISGINVTILNTQMFFTDLLLPLYIISFAGFINIFNLKNKKDIIKLSIMTLISIATIGFFSNGMYLSILLLSYIAILLLEIFRGKKYSNKYKKYTIFLILGIVLISIVTYILLYYPNRNIYASTYVLDIRRDILEKSQLIGETKLEGNLSSEIKLSDWAYGLQDAERTEIFVYLIGKYGYLASIAVVIALAYLVILLFYNINNIKDIYGKNIILGFTVMFLFQSVLHILSNLSYLPANSSVLPLVSYSNFNMIFNIMIIAIVLSIYRRKNIID